MEIVFRSMIPAGISGIEITDSFGNVRLGYPRVACHIADLVEHQLISICSKYASPFTTATYLDLGEPDRSPVRTHEWVLSQIRHACRQADPGDVARYQKVASKLGLSGVHLPFWRDLPGFEPGLVMAPNILHGVLRFWRDHVLQWSLRLIGRDEYDKRLQALQPVPGYRRFQAGIQHLTQWTGRKDRELLRTHVTILCGAPKLTVPVMCNQRAFCDLVYLVQYQSHNETTLGYIDDALDVIHKTKRVYIQLGARRGKRGVINHFNIPKLCNLLEFVHHVREMGSSPQFSTDWIESLHRKCAKELYGFTNRKNFVPQMCERLDRTERISHREEFIEWFKETQEQACLDAMFAQYTPRYRRILSLRYRNSLEPVEREHPVSVKTCIAESRLWLALKPHQPHMAVSAVANEYHLADFALVL